MNNAIQMINKNILLIASKEVIDGTKNEQRTNNNMNAVKNLDCYFWK